MNGLDVVGQSRAVYPGALAMSLVRRVGVQVGCLIRGFQREGCTNFLKEGRGSFAVEVRCALSASRDVSLQQYLLSRGFKGD